MDWDQRCLRFCAGMLLFTLCLRLAGMGVFAPVVRALQSREAISFFLYLQTGRVVRLDPDTPAVMDLPNLTPDPPEEEPDKPVFSESDGDALTLAPYSGEAPDLEELIAAPLPWDLTGAEPAVLILHTHGTESYTPAPDDEYIQTAAYRTLDDDYNMLCLGDLVARRLEEAGIRCIQDRSLHDYPNYNASYQNAAASVQSILEKYPSIQLVLDLHRDAADTAYGQLVTECSVGSQRAAQLMLVVGTDERLSHPDWEENLALALKLQILLERENPGICRDLKLTENRYNQHLGDYALLVEIGAAGNTLPEATLAAEALARAIIQLKNGV